MEELTIDRYLKQVFNLGTQKADWKNWPPNTFAVTTEILKKTGCYRAVLYDRWLESFDGDGILWQKIVEIEAQIWKRQISKRLFEKFGLPFPSKHRGSDRKNIANVLTKQSDLKIYQDNTLDKHIDNFTAKIKGTSFNALRLINQENISSLHPDLSGLVQSIIFIHAVCDEVCTGLGLSGAFSDATSIFNCVANTLLISSGSLSTFDKQICTVLPKMRTPQTGLTIRSFSHHLSCHTTEVEVIWRMIPWINFQENTLNILSVCWPNTTPNTFFFRDGESFKPVNFFRYQSKTDDKLNPFDIIRLIEKYKTNQGIERIHMVVFPEISLNNEEWEELLSCLKSHYRTTSNGKRNQIPIILAGVRDTKKAESHGSNESEKTEFSTNELRIATYFSEKWYVISQRKHHRWSLNESQIRQYDLASKLSTTKRWYEKIEISQRRLSIIAPNGWLSLCPLICEDLAQLEPVSELIRGVGPTLLIALLADGPQLDHRWSSRYASVFADDPGTSVLTLTSSGMLKKSSSKFVDKRQPQTNDDKNTIGLWKDLVTGFHPIQDHLIEENESPTPNLSNFLLTVSADWKEELTADGRTDHTNASVIKFQSTGNERSAHINTKDDPEYIQFSNNPNKSFDLQDWTDIKELSLATVIIEMLITLHNKQYTDTIIENFLRSSDNFEIMPRVDFYDKLLVRIISHSMDPKNAGMLTSETVEGKQASSRAGKKQKWPTASLHILFWYLSKTFDEVFRLRETAAGQSEDFNVLLYSYIQNQLESIYNGNRLHGFDRREAIEKFNSLDIQSELKDTDFRRLHKACLLQILVILHNKLEHLRKKTLSGSKLHTFLFPSKDIHAVSDRQQKDLFNKVERLLSKYGY